MAKSKKEPLKTKSKKLTVKSLKGFEDLKAGFGEPVVTHSGKKKSTVPSDTG